MGDCGYCALPYRTESLSELPPSLKQFKHLPGRQRWSDEALYQCDVCRRVWRFPFDPKDMCHSPQHVPPKVVETLHVDASLDDVLECLEGYGGHTVLGYFIHAKYVHEEALDRIGQHLETCSPESVATLLRAWSTCAHHAPRGTLADLEPLIGVARREFAVPRHRERGLEELRSLARPIVEGRSKLKTTRRHREQLERAARRRR